MNSIIICRSARRCSACVIAIPAAWAMAFAPTKRTKDLLMWMLSTKMMPAVGVLVPIYLIFRDSGLLDTRIGLIVVLVPAQPADHDLDALSPISRRSRTTSWKRRAWTAPSLWKEIVYVLTPMAMPGHRLDRCCSTSSWPGTRRSGR